MNRKSAHHLASHEDAPLGDDAVVPDDVAPLLFALATVEPQAPIDVRIRYDEERCLNMLESTSTPFVSQPGSRAFLKTAANSGED